MSPRLRPLAALALPVALAACGDDRASAPGGVSPGEAKALEEAASMLEERKLPPDALPTDAAAPAAAASPAEMTGDAAPAQR